MLVLTMSVSPIFALKSEGEHTYHGYLGDDNQIEYNLDMETDTLELGKGTGTNPLPNDFSYLGALANEELDYQWNHIRIIKLTENFDAPIEEGLYSFIQEIQTLQKVIVADENAMYSSDDSGALFNKDQTKLYNYPCQNPKSEYTIPSTVLQLGVVNNENPSKDLFSFPFRSANNLKVINFSSAITNLKGSCFSSCSNLEEVNVTAENEGYVSEDGIVFSKNRDKLVYYPANKGGNNYEVPSGVTTIGESAFMDNQYLKTVSLPSTLQTIEYRGFYEMYSLEGEFVIPSTVTSIGYEAFAWCSNLKSIKLGDGSNLTTIPSSCFHGDQKLKSADFENNKSLNNVSFEDSYFSFINLPEGSIVTSFSNNADEYINVSGNSFDLNDYFSYVKEDKLEIVENGNKNGTVITITDVNKPIKYKYNTGGMFNQTPLYIEGTIYTNVSVPISEENFPDAAFRTEIAGSFDTDGNHVLTADELSDSWGICFNACRNIKGIEKIPGLRSLIVQTSEATESLDGMDVSEMPVLVNLLFWEAGHIKFLNVGNNPNLSINIEHVGNESKYNTNELNTTSTMVVPPNGFKIQNLVPGLDIEKFTNTTEGVTFNNGEYSGYSDGTNITYDYNCGTSKAGTVTLHGTITLKVANNYTEIPINEKNFKDAIFRHYIETSIDADKNGALSSTEMAAVRNIDLKLYPQIAYLNGIEYFTELTRLNCPNLRQLSSVNLAQNNQLKEINCDNTGIRNLTISNLKNLETLSCKNTKIKNLAFPTPCKLKNVDCSGTEITKLKVGGLDKLENVVCSSTNITELDLQNNMMLESLICTNSPLDTLLLPNNGILNKFDISNTNLKGMDLNKSTQGADSSELVMSTNLAWLDTGNSNNLSIRAGEIGVDSDNYRNFTGDTIDCSRDVIVSEKTEIAPAKFRAAADTVTLNLESEFPGIDVSKIEVIEGADLEGNCFVDINPEIPVKYTYRCGNYKNGTLKLNVTLNVKKEEPSYIPPYVPPINDKVVNDPVNEVTIVDTGATVGTDGKASAEISGKLADTMIDMAVSNESKEIIIDVTTLKGSNSAEVTLPADSVEAIADKTKVDIVIKTDTTEVTLDNKAAKTIAKTANKGKVTLIVYKTKDEADEMRFKLKVVTENGFVTDFKGGKVTVAVKLNKTLANEENLVCVYIDDNGKYHKVGGKKDADGTYLFTTQHFSSYAVMTEEKADKLIAEQNHKEIASVKNTSLKARSEAGKGYIRVKWTKSSSCKMDYYEVYKATSKTKLKASKRPYFKTKNGNWKSYKNVKGLKKGVKYFYRVRGVKEINGVKYYTKYSTMAYRYAK